MSTKHLVQYLNDHFSTIEPEWTKDELINSFMEKFGVSVKVENHTDGRTLWQFKYDMISAKWQHDITHECRGIILRDSEDGWEIVAHPFNKFFNQQEGHCRLFKEEAFNKECPNLSFVEKADGTCIIIYFDKWNYIWRVSTLGSITTMQLHDSGVTFDDLFRRVVGNEFFTKLTIGKTYILELCTKLNRVVTRYKSDGAFIIGIRNEDGSFMNRSEIEDDYIKLFTDNPNITLPQFAHFSNIDIKSLSAAQSFVERKTIDKTLGEYSEGFVVYDEFGPVCKMKNSVYIALHHSLSDSACTRKAVVSSFFKGTMDDLYPALPEEFQHAADNLKNWLNEFRVYMNVHVAPSFKSTPFSTRKEYALYIQGLPQKEKMFSGFFFSNQEKVCNPQENLGDDFTMWIQQNWEKYDEFWKKICFE